MVFGDNVRARTAARALPRTPTQRRSGQHNTRKHNTKGDRTMQGNRTQPKTGNPMNRTGTTRDRGHHNNTPLPPFNRATEQTEGGHRTQDRGHQQHSRPSLTMPPHHPPYHPTIHDGPTHHHDEGGAHRGYPTTRTPQTHTHHPHTTHPAKNSTRHELQYSPALHWDE